MKRPNIVLLGILATALLTLAGLFGASVASAEALFWYKVGEGGEELTVPSPFSTEKRATFEGLHELEPKLQMECKIKLSGNIGPGVHGEISSFTDGSGNKTIECAQYGVYAECASGFPVTIEALNLPWATELVSVSGQIRNKIKPGNRGGKPELQINCIEGSEVRHEICPFEISSRFLKNGMFGAELSYEKPYSEGGYCSPSNAWGADNLAETNNIEVTTNYFVY